MPQPLELDRTGAVTTVTLNRPEALNALSSELRRGLRDVVRELRDDDGVRAVVLTGAGRAFCAGQDVRELAPGADTPAEVGDILADLNQIVLDLVEMPKPVIAALNGVAAGAGAGLACAADFRIASREASFLLAFANVGLSLDTGTSWLLPRLIGGSRATALPLLAEPVTAEDALAMGLVNAVVDPGHTLPAAQELALRLAAGPTAAYAAIKQSLQFAAHSTLAEALANETRLQQLADASADHQTAVEAFLTKQIPSFTGR